MYPKVKLMITEIILDNVASYKSQATLRTDKKVNVIYGLNGSGKSTLSNYLYDPKNFRYNKCSHTNTDESILVYNQKFIQDNFYEAGNLKGIFSLSKENKEAKEKIDLASKELEKIKLEKEEKSKIITDEKDKIDEARIAAQKTVFQIKRDYTGGDRVLEYCLDRLKKSGAVLYDHISAIPLPKNKPIKTIDDLKDEANSISGDSAVKQTLLSKIEVERLSIDSVDALNTIIIGSEDSPVSGLIGKLNNSDWVSTGLQYLELTESDKCPFCQSDTMTVELVEQIRNYFDETYQNSIEQIKQTQTEYTELVSKIPSLDDYKKTNYGRDYLAKLTEYYSKIEIIIHQNKALIIDKISTPSLQVVLHDVSPYIQDFNTVVGSINLLISENNEKIDNSDRELTRVKKEFWNILRYEYDQTISNLDILNEASNKVIDDAYKVEKRKIKEGIRKEAEIVEHQKSTVNIGEAIENIKQGLIDIGITDFSIEQYGEDLYKVVRPGISTDVFSSLSEGEKMIISFLYFRELFRGKQTATEVQQRKIAVIDDPVSSLSHIFVYNIGQLIKNDFFNSDKVEQIFVLTHSLYFFYELTDANHKRRKEKQNLFRLSKNSLGTSIDNMKYDEIQNDYHSYWSVINDDKQPPVLIANCMRNIIEYFFNFVQKADLSNVVQKPELKGVRFQSFIRYVNRESHSLGQNIFDFKEFDYNDFKEGLRLVFETTGYPEHYKKMSTLK